MKGKPITISTQGFRYVGKNQMLCAALHYEYVLPKGQKVKMEKDISNQIALQINSQVYKTKVQAKFAIEMLPLMPLPREILLKEGSAGRYFPDPKFFGSIACWLKGKWAECGEEWLEKEKKKKSCA